MWYYIKMLYRWITSPLEDEDKYEIIKLDEEGEVYRGIKEKPTQLDTSVIETYKNVLMKNINKENYDKVVKEVDSFNKYKDNSIEYRLGMGFCDELATIEQLTKFLETENPIFDMDDI